MNYLRHIRSYWLWVYYLYRQTIWTAPIIPLEVLMAGVSTIWGLWVLQPFGDSFTGSVTFNVLVYIAPEWAWGLVFFVIGQARIYSIYRKNILYRYRTAWASYLLWGFVAFLVALSRFWSTGFAVYSMFAAFALVIVVRLRVEIKHGLK